jgi:hypothetical protein
MPVKRPGICAAVAGFARLAAVLLALAAALAAQTRIAQFAVTPAAMSFQATDPDLGGPAAQTATVVFRLENTQVQRPWTLYVQAESASMSGCSSIPASALTATCTSATHDSGNNSGKTYCTAAPIPISTSRAVVAYGNQGNRDHNAWVGIAVSMADSWRYQAALSPACTISLRYTLDAP